MNKRKKIGVIISKTDELYQHRLLKGIIKQANAMDFDVLVFTNLIGYCDYKKIQDGEDNIYRLVPFDQLHGLILCPATFADRAFYRSIEERVREKAHCPVYVVDDQSSFYPSLFTDDGAIIRQLAAHLADVHQRRKIYFLGGPASTPQTRARLAAYRQFMTERAFYFDKNFIHFGDLSYQSGIDLASKIIQGTLELPDALICSNDYMALGFTRTMIANGYKIPEQVAVTGFDCITEAISHNPSITSAVPCVLQTGREAVCRIMAALGLPVERPVTFSHREGVILSESCGCEAPAAYIAARQNKLVVKQRYINDILYNSHMSEILTTVSDLPECLHQIIGFRYMIKDLQHYFLMLDDHWNSDNKDESGRRECYSAVGYPSHITCRLRIENNKPVPGDISFSTIDLLPDALWQNYPTGYYFTPVHFNDRCFGYSVLSFGEKPQAFDPVFRNWSINVCNALELIRIRTSLEQANRKLLMSSMCDALTGAYNRIGYVQLQSMILHKAQQDQLPVFLLMADLDDLKGINDTYGHMEGDSAIITLAQALMSSCICGELCIRMGGDEFFVLGTFAYNDNYIETFTRNFELYLERYNSTSGKPYIVHGSIGAVLRKVERPEDFAQMQLDVDNIMYSNKAFRKKQRRSGQ